MKGSTHATIGIWGALSLTQALGQPLVGPLLFAYLGSLWPDIDHPDSRLGRHFRFLYFSFACCFGCQSFWATLLFFTVCTGVFAVIAYLRGLGLHWALGFAGFLAWDWLLWKVLFHQFPRLKEFFHGLFAHRGFSHSLVGWLAFSAPWLFGLLLLHLPLCWGLYFGLGYLLHIGADLLCNSGVPLFWPFEMRRVQLPLFRTRGLREMLLEGVLVWAIVSQALLLANHGLIMRLGKEFGWMRGLAPALKGWTKRL